MKKILVVGATSAIAVACAKLWAVQESEFFLVARDQQKLLQICADLQIRGARAVTPYLMDASDVAAHPVMLEQGLATLQSVDICLIAYGTLPNQLECEQSVEGAMNAFANNASAAARWRSSLRWPGIAGVLPITCMARQKQRFPHFAKACVRACSIRACMSSPSNPVWSPHR